MCTFGRASSYVFKIKAQLNLSTEFQRSICGASEESRENPNNLKMFQSNALAGSESPPADTRPRSAAVRAPPMQRAGVAVHDAEPWTAVPAALMPKGLSASAVSGLLTLRALRCSLLCCPAAFEFFTR